MENVATLLARHFNQWGLSHVFGLPGKPVVPLIMALEQQGVHFVLNRHESGAGFTASGYSLLKEGLGVAIATSGPGGTNLLTAAAQAKAYHAPTLFLTGQPSGRELGKPIGQDSSLFGTDLVKMFEPVTLFSARVDRTDQLEMMLRHALDRAKTGRKGPVHLSIPMDVLRDECASFTIPLPSSRSLVVSSELENVFERLQEAKSPLLFLGKGVHLSKAYEHVQWLAEHWQIPVV
ncbi:thiamine pyrophosphate-binding protein (plasmid) [Pseudalkalibacillus hwajinpoensis]|uniref:thiamine pyrophosphate-binding protein n=1 Tax=Guptibacillus hwajinpoensis TaxID=208199 RepID=UPI00325ABC73